MFKTVLKYTIDIYIAQRDGLYQKQKKDTLSFILWFYRLQHFVAWEVGTIILKETGASIFRAEISTLQSSLCQKY